MCVFLPRSKIFLHLERFQFLLNFIFHLFFISTDVGLLQIGSRFSSNMMLFVLPAAVYLKSCANEITLFCQPGTKYSNELQLKVFKMTRAFLVLISFLLISEAIGQCVFTATECTCLEQPAGSICLRRNDALSTPGNDQCDAYSCSAGFVCDCKYIGHVLSQFTFFLAFFY